MPIIKGRRRQCRLPAAAVVLAVAAAMLGTATAPSVAAAPRPLRAVDLGTLGGLISQAEAINSRSEVVGVSYVSTNFHAFVWRQGKMTDLGVLGHQNSYATDINSRGDVVGYSENAAGDFRAVLWRGGQPNKITELGTFGGPISIANAINDRGEIVGYSTIRGEYPAPLHAFLWRDGRMTDLGTLPGAGNRALAYDINNTGLVVGESARNAMDSNPVRWVRSRIQNLGLLPGQAGGSAQAVNDRGDIAGFFSGPNSDAFLWRNGRYTDVGAQVGGQSSSAFGINNRGQVVGYTDSGRAFVWQSGKTTLLPGVTGAFTGAFDINDQGQVVGFTTDPSGATSHATLWTR